MKRLLISLLAAAFITVVIPLVIVELSRPRDNAASTEPQPVTATEEAAEEAPGE